MRIDAFCLAILSAVSLAAQSSSGPDVDRRDACCAREPLFVERPRTGETPALSPGLSDGVEHLAGGRQF